MNRARWRRRNIGGSGDGGGEGEEEDTYEIVVGKLTGKRPLE
jgi:hypothetical protein